jgi:predicted permease
MSWINRLASTLRSKRLDRDLDDELRFHLEMRTRELIASGLSPEEARREARLRFGNPTSLQESTRSMDTLEWLETLWQDLRYACRVLRRSPGFTTVVVLTLALGIGANTAIFSVVNAVILRPLDCNEPQRLAVLDTADTRYNSKGAASYRDIAYWRSESRTFEEIAVYYLPGWSRQTLTGIEEPQPIQAAFVSSNFFPMLGVAPLLGRTVSAEDVQRRERVVVLSEALWRRRFDGSPSALQATLELDGKPWQVIGVMPETYRFPFRDTQCWMPVTSHDEWRDEGKDLKSRRWLGLGRLKPGASFEQAQAEMSTIAAHLEKEYPDTNAGLTVKVTALQLLVAGNTRLALWVLLGAVAFVLLIACTNVANLVLARGATRERELAVRAALGAGRGRLVRQLLTESLALAAAAGALGLGLALAGIRALVAFGPLDLPRLSETRIDATVLVFTLLASLLAGILFGLAPAWRISRCNPNESLKQGGRATAGSLGLRHARSLLVVAEFALAVVLLAGAGLLIRSFLAVEAVDSGFKTERVLTVHIWFAASTPESRQLAFYRQGIERLAAIPGVEAAGAGNTLFQLGESRGFALREVEGRPAEPRDQWTPLSWTTVSGDYFQALGIPLLRGRFFSQRDRRDSSPVVIINETLARRYWPGEDPIGKRLKGFDPRGRNDEWVTVIGMVADTRTQGRERPPMAQLFQPQEQWSDGTPYFVIRTATRDAQQLSSAVRSVLHAVDKAAAITDVTTPEQRLQDQTSRRRFQAWLFGLFSGVALLLAAIGIYGIMHYSVAQRRHEIGIRMALGARPGDVLGLVVRQGLSLAAIGTAAGLLSALWLTRALATLLFGVTPTDPLTFAGVSAVLLLAALVACWLPARRATRIDPIVALRQD